MSIVLTEDHIYRDGDRTYTSVSKVISTVIRKDIEGVDPAVLANAAERGIRTEQYATEILRNGWCHVPAATERQDVQDRVACFYSWYEEAGKPELLATQEIVSDEANGIAGMLDWRILWNGRRVLVDGKCTANPEPSWRLQVGGYEEMSAEKSDACGVLHINPKYAKGWIWREYDPFIVRSQWRAAVEWWKVLRSLKAEA